MEGCAQGGRGSLGLAPTPLDTVPPPPLTLVLVAPARNLALVSSWEGAAGLRQADRLDELGADGTAVPLLLQPDQDWPRERPEISPQPGPWGSMQGHRGCGLGDPGWSRRAGPGLGKAGQPGLPPARPRPLCLTRFPRCPPLRLALPLLSLLSCPFPPFPSSPLPRSA